METDLRDRWVALVSGWGADRTAALAAFDDVAARYREPVRRYHTLDHVAAVLDAVDDLLASEPVDDPSAVRLAAWLHDVVYDPTRSDNEAASAGFAAELLAGLGVAPATVAVTVRLIELTAGHEVAPSDRDGAVLVDADLSILGAPPEAYDRYAEAVRAEYAHVPDGAFRSGRAAVLEGLLAHDPLFTTATARARWGGQASANLTRELRRLRAG